MPNNLQVAEVAPKVAQAAPKQAPADPSTSVGSPIVLLALAGVAVFGVLFAKQAQPQADSKNSGAVAKSPTASSNGAPASKGQAPQSAGMHCSCTFTHSLGFDLYLLNSQLLMPPWTA